MGNINNKFEKRDLENLDYKNFNELERYILHKLFILGQSVKENLKNYNFSKAQITIFAVGSQIAKDWIPKAAKQTIVIDNSSFFRMQKNIPLVVPEVNPDALDKHENIIANPNCSTMQMVLVLKPLHDE